MALRAARAELVGVRGTLYPRPGSADRIDRDALVLHDSPDIAFTVARQAVRQLAGITVVTAG